ncbi:MAG TPA: RNA polymerase sigma factor [Chitinophagaceae bacterium]|jgi:RNA polymerase sigma-70 factor (ECF subfamily)
MRKYNVTEASSSNSARLQKINARPAIHSIIKGLAFEKPFITYCHLFYMTNVAVCENHFCKLLKSKNPEAFSALYDSYSGALYTVIYKIVKNSNIAEELLQDVFVKVWKNIDRYDAARGTLFTWMLKIARNTSVDHLRSSQHKMQLNSKVCEQETEESIVAESRHYNAENMELRGLALKLEDKYKQVIDLVYFWGYSQEEVSQILNLPLGTVKTRCRTGLRQLKRLYQN